MSNITGKRRAIAAALDAVEGVVGHVFRPPGIGIGDAWPLLSTLARAQGDAFVVHWRVRVIPPQEEETASTWMDSHWDALFFALKPHGHITLAEPVLLAVGGGDLYALEITLLAEEE